MARLRIVALIAVTVAGLVACGEAEDTGDNAGATGGVLTVAVDSIGPGEWAPARTGDSMQDVSKHLFSTLTRIDHKTRQFEGLLAESYSISDDGLTWTFKLREGVPFHGDWGTVTAEDVKFSWGEWISEESNHANAAPLSQAVDGDINNFKVINDLEFSVTTSEPVVTLETVLSDQGNGLQVVPKRYYEQEGAKANEHPIGTGPWEFVSYKLGVEAVYKAVPDHFNQSPSFDQLVLKEVPDSAARLTQLQSGAVDMALLDSNLVGEATAAGLEIRKIPDVGNVFVILGGSYWGTDALDRDAPWIQADAPEKGKAIREALSLAIDRDLIAESVLKGTAEPAAGPLLQDESNPALREDSWSVPEHDLDQAKQKLAEGGYPDGFEITLYMYPDYVDLPGIGEAMAGMWEEIGITVNRRPGDEGVLEEQMDARKTDGLAWVKVAGLKGEPATQLVNYRVDAERSNGFYHPAIDRGYADMILEQDRDKRYVIAREVIDALRSDMIALPMFTVDLPFVVGPQIGEWAPVPGLDEMTGLETVQRR
ncbi:MAG TPA: ABC transporter substrate-binding protein [Actinophytocola sp.]|nr:ABC transporter substrate-binding protein [Actinophytocola sp.]